MKYAEFIKGNESFQYSINLQYDLMNSKKVESYIPTRKSIELLKEYLLNVTTDNRDKATVLVGPYGKGKSHLLLILLGLMCEKSESKEYLNLLSKIEKIDSNCAEIGKEVLTKKKYLPMIINFNSLDLNQAFLVSLNNALNNVGLSEILPNTYFDSVIKTLHNWNEHEDSSMISKVEKMIFQKSGLSLNKYIEKIRAFDNEAYNIFKDVFSEVTSGIEFNPMVNSDIVKLIEETNYILREKYNYDGIIIVFDEFSKFIEASADSNNVKDLKILQDIAELSSRSKNPQLHLVCITHKTINEYISQIPQEKIDAWRTIEGRFKEILFVTSSQQNYELISNATIKDLDKLGKYLNDNKKYLEQFSYEGERLFDDIYTTSDYIEEIAKKCFPLHPYTTYALPIVSEKIAQNERTLFTYLSKNEPFSLIDFVNRNNGEFELITLDRIYDYFEPLLKKEINNQMIYDIWVQADTALKIVYSDIEKKIIKTLAIISLVNDKKIFTPNEYTIIHSLQESSNDTEKAIESLKQSGVIILRKGTETLDFLPISSVDVKKKIKNIAESKFKNINYADVYSELVDFKYILPKKYNDKFKITRFFNRVFINAQELLSYSNSEQLLMEYKADGLIIDILYNNKSQIKELMEWLKDTINDDRILINIPENELDLSINDLIAEYQAIKLLKANKDFLQEDKAIESQLDLLFDDLNNKLCEYICENYDLESDKCTLYTNVYNYKFINSIKLSELLSNICEANFPNTPKINNELINKNHISGPIQKGRDLIINMLLNNTYNQFDYNKNSVECTIYRATVVNQDLENNILLDEIKNFIEDAEVKEVSFDVLYKNLISNKKGIGTRKGIIPIYLAYILKDYKDEAVLYLKSGRSKKEVLLDSKILININENPQTYMLKIEKGSVEKNNYISKLEDLFLQYTNLNTDNKYYKITKGMQAWYQSLSRIAQKSNIDLINNQNIPESYLKLRDSMMRYEINYRQFLFDDVKKIFKSDLYDEIIKDIVSFKNYLDGYELNVKQLVIRKANEILNDKYNGSLSNNIKLWYGSLENEKKTHLYSGSTNEFIKFASNIENNDINNINTITKIFTGLFIEDWNDETINDFLIEFEASIKSVENYEISSEGSNKGTIKIIIDEDENSLEKSFNKTEISEIGSMLLNAINESIDDFGESIDDNEKRNILMNILERYI